MNNNSSTFIKGIWDNNPVLVQILGMCPTLAVTNSVSNAIGMSLATAFVLICSSTLISIIKNIFATEVRIMGYIVVIASFVTLTEIIMKAKFYPLSLSLGPYLPLIVVNCIILGRAEAFASKNGVFASIIDAIGSSIGFFIALFALGFIRELMGTGMIMGINILSIATTFVENNIPFMLNTFIEWTKPWTVMTLAPGAFFGLAILIALKKNIDMRKLNKDKN